MVKNIGKIICVLFLMLIGVSCTNTKVSEKINVSVNHDLKMNLISDIPENVFFKEKNGDLIYYVEDLNQKQVAYEYNITTKTKKVILQVDGIVSDLKVLNNEVYVAYLDVNSKMVYIVKVKENAQIIDQYKVDALQKMVQFTRFDNSLCYLKNDNKYLALNCLNKKQYTTDIPQSTFPYIEILNNTENILLITKDSETPTKKYVLKYLKDGKFKTVNYSTQANDLQVDFVAFVKKYVLLSNSKTDSGFNDYYLLDLNNGKTTELKVKSDVPLQSTYNLNVESNLHLAFKDGNLFTFRVQNNEIVGNYFSLAGKPYTLSINEKNEVYYATNNKVYQLIP